MAPCCKLTSTRTCVSNKKRIPYFFNQTPRLLFILLLVLCSYYLRTATIQGWCLFLWKAQRHQRQLDKVCTSETVTVTRCCQQYAQPVSPAVSRGNNSYKTNSPSASVVTIVRNHLHTCACVCAAFISCGYYSRVVFISFKSFGLCGYYLRAASN